MKVSGNARVDNNNEFEDIRTVCHIFIVVERIKTVINEYRSKGEL